MSSNSIGTLSAKTLWYAKRPLFWRHACEQAIRSRKENHDTQAHRDAATTWAAQRAQPLSDALKSLSLTEEINIYPADRIQRAHDQISQTTAMGEGPANMDMLYTLARLPDCNRIVETGVSYGWSSAAVLLALHEREEGKLCSVDMPLALNDNSEIQGIAIDPELKNRWSLYCLPDVSGLPRAIAKLGGAIDLAHYDSDKTYWGRQFGYNLIWQHLREGGLLISDDIEDNLFFKTFVEKERADFAVIDFDYKYIGVIKK